MSRRIGMIIGMIIGMSKTEEKNVDQTENSRWDRHTTQELRDLLHGLLERWDNAGLPNYIRRRAELLVVEIRSEIKRRENEEKFHVVLTGLQRQVVVPVLNAALSSTPMTDVEHKAMLGARNAITNADEEQS